MQIGRLEIFTDEPEITEKNVIRVLRNALPKHLINATRCDFLLNYEAGEQPNTAIKTTRKDIQSFCPDNLAHKITEFKLGFIWGFPISMVQRGEKDSGEKKDESTSIALLNEQYEMAKVRKRTQELARFIEICGTGFSYIDINTEYEEGDSYFTLNILDPRTTFIVKSRYYPDHRPLLAVSYREDEMGNRYFTCFTKQQRFEISGALKIKNGEIQKDDNGEPITNWFERERSGEKNPLGMLPMIEWIRSYDRMGCFEHQIPAMNDLNALRSNFMNSIQQNTNSLWHYNDVDFPVDENGNEINPKTGEIVRTFTTPDGKSPTINPLTLDYNYDGLLNKIVYDRSIILEECDVPQRSENVSNSTGIATSDATGWSAAENAANKQQNITEDCKMEEVRVACRAMQISPYIPQDSPILDIKYSDTKPNIKRQKNYELTIKANYMATLLNLGFYGEHVIKGANAFDDPEQVWIDSREMIEAIQKSKITKPTANEGTEETRTTDGGIEAQISNSPMLDGMSKENPEKVEG